jgi:CRISPR-associated protein Cas2
MKYYLYCYDIASDKQRLRCAKILLNYGERIQESVYQIAVRKHREIIAINRRLLQQIDPDTDKIHCYYIAIKNHPRCQKIQPLPSPAITPIPFASIH